MHISIRRPLAVAIALAFVPLAHAQSVPPADKDENVTELDLVTVVGVSPVAGTDIEIAKLPYNVQSADDAALQRSQAFDLSDFMNRNFAGVTINQAQNNPLQPDLQFRGFTATPLLGGSEGISVYLDGVRVNEVFGDTVNWDLIPEDAVERMSLMAGSNPVFGLNTLGGALAMNTKSGFAFPGGEAKVTLGSFGRRSLDAEHGGHADNKDYYVATSLYDDRGWAAYNPSRIRQFFGKVGYQSDRADLDLSLMYADNLLNGNQNVPLSTLGNP
ncbi:MAG: TonB-dependent receptor plug domain-containing protein, partial [Rhodanobacteraceae bacterium]